MPALQPSVWEDILGHVRVQHPELVRGWFSQLEPRSLYGGILRIRAQNPLQVRYLDDLCRVAFTESAQAALGQLVSAAFESDEVGGNGHAASKDEGFDPTVSLQLNNDYVFDNFVVGPGNRLAHAASVAVAEAPGTTYNPLFVHGDVGLGKTHLLQAICHETNRLGTCANTLYISCETFMNHYIEAVERGMMKEFRYRYREVDMLVIDDIQFLGERERSQEEFFHTFNTLHQAQKQIILSADCSPAEIPSLEGRLVSRFNSGLVASIDMPCMETRMAIIRKKARLRCIEVGEDVIKFVAERIESNIRDLEGALVKLDALSHTRGGKIDLALAQEALGPADVHHAITVQQIVDVVTRRFSVRLADLQSKKRTKSITHPRQVCMYLARELTSHSLEEVGGFFGGRDHTTVLHAHRAISTARGADAKLNGILEDLIQALRQRRVEVNS
ncbi:MAG TPA: chromosomal replication initiator protein DnaA [Phycisphaerae bacterium]|nr:chromosomal replication initiator protein DnaA [Phycisphaerales bacterium]HRX85545.1 chromosomal replication initiator protein DnaA [Phycisphaerae bacterium]